MKLNFSPIRAFLIGVGSATAIMAGASVANAATFTANVNGTDYDITTVNGTYLDLSATLKSQVWWGNEALAQKFAQTVGTSLPAAYAWRWLSIPTYGVGMAVFSSFPYTSFPIYDDGLLNYAIATKVPAASPVSVPDSSGTIPTAVVSLAALGVLEKAKKNRM
jgi:hypothetical protein